MSKLITIESGNRPTNATNGDLFYETDTGRLLLYYEGFRAYGTANTTQPEKTDLAVSIVANTDNLQQTISDNQGADIVVDTNIDTIVAVINGTLINFAPDDRQLDSKRVYRDTNDDLEIESEQTIDPGTGAINTNSNSGVHLTAIPDTFYVTYQRDGQQVTRKFQLQTLDTQPLVEHSSLTVTIDEAADDILDQAGTVGLFLNSSFQDHDDHPHNMPVGLVNTTVNSPYIIGDSQYTADNHTWCYRLSADHTTDDHLFYQTSFIDTQIENISWTVTTKFYMHAIDVSQLDSEGRRITSHAGYVDISMVPQDDGYYYIHATDSNLGSYDGHTEYLNDGLTKHQFQEETWYNLTIVANRDSWIDNNTTGTVTIKWFVNGAELYSVTSEPGSNIGYNQYSFREWFGQSGHPKRNLVADVACVGMWYQALTDGQVQAFHNDNQVFNKNTSSYLPMNELRAFICADHDMLGRNIRLDATDIAAITDVGGNWAFYKNYNGKYFTREELYHKIQY